MKKIDNIITKMVKEHGENVFEDSKRFRSIFKDYSNGNFENEMDTICNIIDLGVFAPLVTKVQITSEKKERHVLSTTGLAIGIFICTIIIAFYMIVARIYYLPHIFLYTSGIISMIMLLKWKKAGFWLLCGTVLVLVLLSFIPPPDFNPRNNWSIEIYHRQIIKTITLSLMAIIGLWGILQFPKNGKTTWIQLEKRKYKLGKKQIEI